MKKYDQQIDQLWQRALKLGLDSGPSAAMLDEFIFEILEQQHDEIVEDLEDEYPKAAEHLKIKRELEYSDKQY